MAKVILLTGGFISVDGSADDVIAEIGAANQAGIDPVVFSNGETAEAANIEGVVEDDDAD